MKYFTHIRPNTQTLGTTPRAIGLNVEMQDHHETSNLWDWVADSGSTVIRSFHPEQHLRKEQANPDDYPNTGDQTGFAEFRNQIIQNPESAVPWQHFAFADHLPWMGVPDGFVDCYHRIGCDILFSLGWLPSEFTRPILRSYDGPAEEPHDDEIDWGAAAVAYEYYFAVIHHYAQRGGTRFLMCNEPENREGGWQLPDDLAKLSWGQRFWDDDAPGPSQRFLDIVTRQYAVLCRMARLAMDDVKKNLQRDDLLLCGPTTVVWDALWRVASPYCDIFDYHHYHPDPAAFSPMHQAAAATANDKPMMISEFNRLSGAVDIADSPFVFANALDTAKLLQEIVTMHRGTQPLDAVTLYLLAFPSTHRNHKHLVYGDLNVADWSGRDTPLWNRGSEWYPTFDELQLRHATPAYHAFRMMARLASGQVLNHGMLNPSSSGPADSYFDLRIITTKHADHTIITVINDKKEARSGVFIDCAALGLPQQVVLRRLDRQHSDAVIADLTPTETLIDLGSLPGLSLTQAILYDTCVAGNYFNITEASITPGNQNHLDLWQTTRLRAHCGAVDVSERDVIWSSSHPELVAVSQSGLLQRRRRSPQAVTITAKRGDQSQQIIIPESKLENESGHNDSNHNNVGPISGAAGPDAVGRGL